MVVEIIMQDTGPAVREKPKIYTNALSVASAQGC
jgi:hypothetical protein